MIELLHLPTLSVAMDGNVMDSGRLPQAKEIHATFAAL